MICKTLGNRVSLFAPEELSRALAITLSLESLGLLGLRVGLLPVGLGLGLGFGE